MWKSFRILTTTYLRIASLWSLPILGLLIVGPWMMMTLIQFKTGVAGLDSFSESVYFSFFMNYVCIMLVGAGAIAWGPLPDLVIKARMCWLPLSNRLLATFLWLIPACVIMTCNVVTQSAYLIMFQSHWPMLTTTVSVGASGMLLMALAWWLRDFRYSKIPVALATVFCWGYWFVHHSYPDGFRQAAVYWHRFSADDIVVLLATTIGSWLLTVVSFSKYRCGEAESGNLIRHLHQPPYAAFSERANTSTALPKSKSAFESLLALEWVKGRFITICSTVLMSLFLCLVLAGTLHDHRNPRKALAVLFPMLGFLCGTISGLWMGAELWATRAGNMKQSFSTLPFSDFDLSRAFLKTCQRSVLFSSLALIAVGVVIVAGYAVLVESISVSTMLTLQSHSSDFEDPGVAGGILLLITSPFVAWVACGNMAAITATGRQRVQLAFGVSIPACAVIVMILPIFFGTWGEWAAGIFALVCAAGFGIVGTTWLFVLAFRRKLICPRSTLGYGAVAVALLLAICFLLPAGIVWKIVWCSAACLIFSPLAAVPVAISCNRHR